MSDKLYPVLTGCFKKLKEMSDGTYAEVVCIEGSLSTSDDPFTIAGRTRDNTKDLVFNFSDGTSETFYYTTAGLLQGKGARA
jgi:hypothetical protein